MIKFTKMQGLGNDFIVIDAIQASITPTPQLIQQMADRHYGIGCDQVLLITEPPHTQCDFGYRIFNADGSEVEQCGNGARCFARFVYERGLTTQRHINVSTFAGPLSLHIQQDNQVEVNMGTPHLTGLQQLTLTKQTVTVETLTLPNPHAVLVVSDITEAQVNKWGKEIATHHHFPQGTNAGFMQIIDTDTIALRVYERGVGETLACGSGACAAAVCAMLKSPAIPRNTALKVRLSGGDLMIRWAGKGHPIFMTGPAEFVFDGEWLNFP